MAARHVAWVRGATGRQLDSNEVNQMFFYQSSELVRVDHWKGLGMTARKVLASLATIKTGDIILPLVDGRELRLRRVSRPDSHQAEILTRLGLQLPERVGTDNLSSPVVVQT